MNILLLLLVISTTTEVGLIYLRFLWPPFASSSTILITNVHKTDFELGHFSNGVDLVSK
jgi:hypothetical protein